MTTSILDLVRAAVRYRCEAGEQVDLIVAADTLDTSTQVVLDRGEAQRIFDYLDTGKYDADELQDAADHLGDALKEQS